MLNLVIKISLKCCLRSPKNAFDILENHNLMQGCYTKVDIILSNEDEHNNTL